MESVLNSDFIHRGIPDPQGLRGTFYANIVAEFNGCGV